MADGDPSSYIPGIYNGVPAKLVGNMWRYSGCYWLVANNDIQDFSDLEGEKSRYRRSFRRNETFPY